MKKWVMAASLIVLILFSFFSINNSNKGTMKIYVLTQKRAEKITSNLSSAEESGTLLERQVFLTFEGERLAYDEASNTFFLPLSMQTENWEKGSFATTNSEFSPFFLNDFVQEKKLSLMSENTRIPVYLVGESSYFTANLKITGVSIADFMTSEETLEDGTPLFQLRVYDNEGNYQADRDFVKKCYTASKLRGNTSLSYEKKSLRLNLYEKKESVLKKANRNFLGMRDDNDWILNALYADGSKIKDKLANDLWEQTGASDHPYNKTYGSHLEYVEVFINNAYQGLYGLMYPIDRKQLDMKSVSSQLAKKEEVVERIYKKKYSADWKESDFIGELPDNNMPDYRGGFYLKGDTILSNEEEWEPLRELAACIESEDTVFAEQITKITDQSNVLDNWLFYQAIAGFDNYAKNMYYIARNKGGSYYGYFIPWDLNISFGDVYADNQYFCKADSSVVRELIAWEPAQRMIDLNVNNSRELLSLKWGSWRKDIFSDEAVFASIDALEKTVKVSGAYEREKARWPGGRYEDDFTNMKEFTKERLSYVDEYIEGLMNKK